MATKKNSNESAPAKVNARPLEMAIIGFALTYPERFYDVADLREEHFLIPSCRKAFRAIRTIESRNHHELAETALVAAEMAKSGVPQDESLALMVEATDYAPQSPEAVRGIIDQLLTESMRRSLVDAGVAVSKAAETMTTADEGATAAIGLVQDAIGRNVTSKVTTMSEAIEAELQRMESGGEAGQMGHRTGLVDLDEMITGIHGGEFIIVAARPSMGKSALVGGFAVNMAYEQELPGVIISLEMPADQWTQRAISTQSGVNITHVRRNIMKPVERSEYVRWAVALQSAKIFINDAGGLSFPKIGAAIRRLYYEEGIKWVIVDYLQLVDHVQKSNESTNDAISRTSTGLKSLARSLNIPIIALSQLNRDCEKRDNKRPRLSDLRSSGSLEQDADVVIFIYRDDYYHEGDEQWMQSNPDKLGVAELIVGKQRNGPIGTVRVAWISQCARFRNLTTTIPQGSYTKTVRHREDSDME